MLKRLTTVWFASLLVACGQLVMAGQSSPVIVDFFFQGSCQDCRKIRATVLPALDERFHDFYVLKEHDTGIASNAAMLVAYQQKLGVRESRPVTMVVDSRWALSGLEEIEKGLMGRVDESLAERQDPAWKAAGPIEDGKDVLEVLRRRSREWTPGMMIVNGLLDGLNPCAFSTIVFLVTLLTAAGVGGRRRLAMGAAFCLGTFVAYTAVGFAVFRALYVAESYARVRLGLNLGMSGVLGVLAVISLFDAYRFWRTGDPGTVRLQMAAAAKEKVRGMMRGWVRGGSLLAAGFLVGAGVTILEGVCTGQLYVPTLVALAQSGVEPGRAWSYLLLYNSMFVVPLIAVFGVAQAGWRMERLIAWSRGNVVVAKVLLGIFFLAMGAMLVVMSGQ